MKKLNYLTNTFKLLKLDRKDISTIYLYAIAAGIISLGLPLGIQAIIGFVMAAELSTSLVLLIGVVVSATFFYGFFQISQLKLIEKIKQKIFVRFSLAFNEKLELLDIQKNREYQLSELMNRFFDTITFQKSMSKLLIDIPASSIQIFLGLILLAFYHPLFILFGIFLLVTLYLLLRFTGIQGMKTSIEESTNKYQLAYWLEEQADYIKDVNNGSFGQLKDSRTGSILNQYLSSRTEHFKVLHTQFWALTLFKVVLTGVMLIVGTYLLLEQLINIGQFVAAEIVIILLLSAIEKVIFGLDNAYDLLTSTKKLYQVFDLPENSYISIDQVDTENGIQQFQAENLTLLSNEGQTILENISFSLQPGDICCIAGKSGSGKTSLINIITGVYKNYKGRLSVNDIVINDKLGIIPKKFIAASYQESGLVVGTIYENISFDSDQLKLQDIINLAKEVGFHNAISNLENGYQTQIESHKANVSGNIRQMVLLLRNLIRKVPIHVFEMPFEHLEKDEVNGLRKYWEAHSKDRIFIYTTHNNQYESYANKTIQLHKGTLVFFGKN